MNVERRLAWNIISCFCICSCSRLRFSCCVVVEGSAGLGVDAAGCVMVGLVGCLCPGMRERSFSLSAGDIVVFVRLNFAGSG